MFFIDLLFVFIIAFVLTLLLGAGFRKQRFGAGMFIFFLIIFLATWAGGAWVTPIGPMLWGSYWLSFLVIGFFVALIVTALVQPEDSSRRYETREEAAEESVIAFDIFLWILIIGLVISIAVAYM